MKKVFSKINKQIDLLELDLSGKSILTEAATGAYFVTSFIAAEAGAEVTAFAKNSRYGNAAEVISFNKNILRYYGNKKSINFTETLSKEIIGSADIITNSGHLRPLNEEKLKYIKQWCVIPLMYESWEYRESDIDLDFCRKKKIIVGATNERHPDIDVFSYLGDMAIKMIMDSGLCLYRNKFVLICNNDFGPYIANVLSELCEGVGVIDKNERKELYNAKTEWLGTFPEINIPEKYKEADAIIFTAYPFDKKWIGGNGCDINADKIVREFNNPFILRYAGDIDTKELSEKNVPYFPEEVMSGHMGVLPSDIGYDPIIRLQSGGLKAGQLMLEGKTEFKNIKLAELIT